jgi:PII-like signaling protein
VGIVGRIHGGVVDRVGRVRAHEAIGRRGNHRVIRLTVSGVRGASVVVGGVGSGVPMTDRNRASLKSARRVKVVSEVVDVGIFP